MKNYRMNQDHISNIYEIKNSLNTKFEKYNLDYRIYIHILDSYEIEDGMYEPTYLGLSINLKTKDHGYYTLKTIKLTSNMCALFSEKDVMEVVIKNTMPESFSKIVYPKKVNQKVINNFKSYFNISNLFSILVP